MFGISLGNCLHSQSASVQPARVLNTYSKQLDVVQDLVVEGEVIAWDDVNSSLLLYLPVLKAESLALAQ